MPIFNVSICKCCPLNEFLISLLIGSGGVVRLQLSNGVHYFTILSSTESGDFTSLTRRVFIGKKMTIHFSMILIL